MGLGHDHEVGSGHRRALALALAITASFTVVEVIGGFLTGSLAVLADAVHMLSDNVSIALALVALWLAAKPATPERTYGYKRAEVLAALANGVTLVALAGGHDHPVVAVNPPRAEEIDVPVVAETPAGEVPATAQVEPGKEGEAAAAGADAAAKGDAKGGAKPEAKGGKAEGKKKE